MIKYVNNIIWSQKLIYLRARLAKKKCERSEQKLLGIFVRTKKIFWPPKMRIDIFYVSMSKAE